MSPSSNTQNINVKFFESPSIGTELQQESSERTQIYIYMAAARAGSLIEWFNDDTRSLKSKEMIAALQVRGF